MLIAVFGESCTGKSTLAEKIADKLNARVYSGRDYLRFGKTENEAQSTFKTMLEESVKGIENTVYVTTEKEHLALLPSGCTRILVTAELDTIMNRFAKRMNGSLPPPVAAMLERKHGMFDNVPHDIHVHGDGDVNTDELIQRIKAAQ